MSFHIPFFLFSTVSFYFLSVGWFKLRRKFLEHPISTPFLEIYPEIWHTYSMNAARPLPFFCFVLCFVFFARCFLVFLGDLGFRIYNFCGESTHKKPSRA